MVVQHRLPDLLSRIRVVCNPTKIGVRGSGSIGQRPHPLPACQTKDIVNPIADWLTARLPQIDIPRPNHQSREPIQDLTDSVGTATDRLETAPDLGNQINGHLFA
jgi:hypothetical protein